MLSDRIVEQAEDRFAGPDPLYEYVELIIASR
jgi:hypothetical protein